MKDPLRYYVAEGFMIIVCFPDPENYGKTAAKYRCTGYVADKLRAAEIDGVRCLVVNNTAYPVNDNFFMDYAVRAKNEEEAVSKIHDWAAATDVANAEFIGAMKLMEMV